MPFDPVTDFFVSDGLPLDHNSLNNSGPIRVLIQAADPTFYACVDKRGNQLPIYQVVDGRGKGNTDVVWAYWCPYDQDRFGYTTLTGGCNYMFTATMDGCSFGVGHTGGDGSILVGHVNSTRLQSPTGDTTAMEDDQKRTLKMMLSSGPGGKKKPTLFQPKNYRYRHKVREVSATTFGVREGGKWKFYAHRWVKSYQGMQVVYEYVGLTKIR
jgi:hypothetical protein